MAVCPHECDRQHVTLDIDVPYGTAIPLPSGYSMCIHTRRSCGGNTHVYVCMDNGGQMSSEALFGIRVLWHDDSERISADRARYTVSHDMRYAEGVLFDARGDEQCGPWESLPGGAEGDS